MFNILLSHNWCICPSCLHSNRKNEEVASSITAYKTKATWWCRSIKTTAREFDRLNHRKRKWKSQDVQRSLCCLHTKETQNFHWWRNVGDSRSNGSVKGYGRESEFGKSDQTRARTLNFLFTFKKIGSTQLKDESNDVDIMMAGKLVHIRNEITGDSLTKTNLLNADLWSISKHH